MTIDYSPDLVFYEHFVNFYSCFYLSLILLRHRYCFTDNDELTTSSNNTRLDERKIPLSYTHVLSPVIAIIVSKNEKKRKGKENSSELRNRGLHSLSIYFSFLSCPLLPFPLSLIIRLPYFISIYLLLPTHPIYKSIISRI